MFPLLKTMQKKKKKKSFTCWKRRTSKYMCVFFLFLFFFSHQINKRIDRMICYAQQPSPQARKRKQTEIKAHQNKVCQRIKLKCVLYCSCKLSRIQLSMNLKENSLTWPRRQKYNSVSDTWTVSRIFPPEVSLDMT